MGIALREHKKIEKKQEKPISLGCNTMSVKKTIKGHYERVSWDKETEAMSIMNTRGETDHWHLHILVGVLQVTAYCSVFFS